MTQPNTPLNEPIMDLPHPIVAFLQVAVPFRSWPLFCAGNRPSCRFVALVFQAILALLTMGLVVCGSSMKRGRFGPTREP